MAKLGDAEPWATIRDSLEDIVTVWRATHPGFRTAFDRGTWTARQRRPRRRKVVE